MALVEQLLDEVWAGPAALVINPGWGQQGAAPVPDEYGRVLDSINVVYSFLPCAIQVRRRAEEGWFVGVDSEPIPVGTCKGRECGSRVGRGRGRALVHSRTQKQEEIP